MQLAQLVGFAWEARRDEPGREVIGEKIVAVLGDPPKRVGVTEFESLNKAEAWINSPERKALAPQREKAVKFIRQYIVEGK